jgi:DNA replication protein DnaC
LKNEIERRRKAAHLPLKNDLGAYDKQAENGLTLTRINQLRELNWLDQGFNLMLLGPSGTGKTFLAAGLADDAMEKGYKTYFKTMEYLTSMLTCKLGCGFY